MEGHAARHTQRKWPVTVNRHGPLGRLCTFEPLYHRPQGGSGGLFRRLAVASHAVPKDGQTGGLKIAVAPLRCFVITFLKCFFSRHRHRSVRFRSRVRFRSLSFLCKGLRSGGNNNRGDYQKREGPHEKSPLHDLGVSHLTQSCDEMAKPP